MPHVNKTKIQTFSAFYLILFYVTWLFNFFHIDFYKNKLCIGLTVKKKTYFIRTSFIRTFNRKNFGKSKSSIYVHIN